MGIRKSRPKRKYLLQLQDIQQLNVWGTLQTKNYLLNRHCLMDLSSSILHDSASWSVLFSSGRRRKSKTSTSKKEEKLLKQLRQTTQLIHEGRLEADSPEMEAEEVPYCVEWEGTRRTRNLKAPHILSTCVALIVENVFSRKIYFLVIAKFVYQMMHRFVR